MMILCFGEASEIQGKERKGKPSSSSSIYHRASTLNIFSFTDYWYPSLGHSSANVVLRKKNSWFFLWLVNLFVKKWR